MRRRSLSDTLAGALNGAVQGYMMAKKIGGVTPRPIAAGPQTTSAIPPPTVPDQGPIDPQSLPQTGNVSVDDLLKLLGQQ